jgi:branched-chain amino acid transport system substrate-binding protein
VLVFPLVILIATFAASYQAHADQLPIKIGGLIVITGQYAMQGNAFLEGAQLAVDEVNQRGGIAGRPVEFRAEDTANLPMQALTAARKLISEDQIIAAISTSYPELATGANAFQKRGIPVVHLWDSSPDIESMGENLFAIGPWTPSNGETSARFAYRRLGAKTAVTISTSDPWSLLITDYFIGEFRKLGGKVLQSFSFDPQERDFRSAFAKVSNLGPDVVYAPVTDNLVPFYSQLRQTRIKSAIVTSDVVADEHIRQAPLAFEGIFISLMKDPSGPGISKLAVAYEKKFGRPMTLPWFVAVAYDGIHLITGCMEKVGAVSGKIRDCLASTHGIEGLTQTFSFTPGGSSPQFQSIFIVRNQKITFHWDEGDRQ